LQLLNSNRLPVSLAVEYYGPAENYTSTCRWRTQLSRTYAVYIRGAYAVYIRSIHTRFIRGTPGYAVHTQYTYAVYIRIRGTTTAVLNLVQLST
jgi:hypothetical protein